MKLSFCSWMSHKFFEKPWHSRVIYWKWNSNLYASFLWSFQSEHSSALVSSLSGRPGMASLFWVRFSTSIASVPVQHLTHKHTLRFYRYRERAHIPSRQVVFFFYLYHLMIKHTLTLNTHSLLFNIWPKATGSGSWKSDPTIKGQNLRTIQGMHWKTEQPFNKACKKQKTFQLAQFYILIQSQRVIKMWYWENNRWTHVILTQYTNRRDLFGVFFQFWPE